jgi:hypothetical protein
MLGKTWARRALAVIMVLANLACTVISFPSLFPTPTTTPLPPPTATPLPLTLVNFTVHLPANSPTGSAPQLQLMDEVLGTANLIALTNNGNNMWSTTVQTAAHTVLKYRYLRDKPVAAQEVTALNQPIPYRLYVVPNGAAYVEDQIAAWSDVASAIEVGHLGGRVWNRNTAQGVGGLIVEAAGQTALTAHDGSFLFLNIPVGAQRATVVSADGSLRATQVTTTVVKNAMTEVDLVSDDPNAVHITLVVKPANLPDDKAILRVAGNWSQLGSVWQPQGNGSFVPAARAPAMIKQADGSWAISLLLYEGMVARYRYTLGDGSWNGELNPAGQARIRQINVPLSDQVIYDSVAGWHSDATAEITFEATPPTNTPIQDQLAIQFRTDRWLPPLPMWRASNNEWRFTLYNPTNFSGSVSYRYCRNFACSVADDIDTVGEGSPGRFFSSAVFGQDLRETINGWQWLGAVTPASGVLPQINTQPSFMAGVDFPEAWSPATLPNYAAAFAEARNTGANWVTLTRRGAVQGLGQRLNYTDLPALAPLPYDWLTLAQQARNSGLRVALHPATCQYTPYGNCEYWNGLNTGGNFWNEWFSAYERYVLSQADLAQQAGAEMLVIGDYKLRPALPGEPEAAPDADTRWRNLIKNVRAKYNGLLAFELLMGQSIWPNAPAFLDSVDVIRIAWWGTLATTSTPLIADMTTTAGGLMDANLKPLADRFKKPIVIIAAYYSADGAATHCIKNAAGQCRSFEDFDPTSAAANDIGLDLAEQADAYSAMLTALNSRPWINGFATFGYQPIALLRDKSLSVRGKPAEAVLSAWFPKILGR